MRRIFWSRRFDQLLQPKRLAILEACLIGLVAGLSAVLLKQGVAWLGGWRIAISHELPALLVIPTFGLLFGILAGILVERVAPESSGSGIPQVKAVLNRVPMVFETTQDFNLVLPLMIGCAIAYLVAQQIQDLRNWHSAIAFL